MTVFVHSKGIYEGPTSGEPWPGTVRSGGRRGRDRFVRDRRGMPGVTAEVAVPLVPHSEKGMWILEKLKHT